jgi:hypothetical protein
MVLFGEEHGDLKKILWKKEEKIIDFVVILKSISKSSKRFQKHI